MGRRVRPHPDLNQVGQQRQVLGQDAEAVAKVQVLEGHGPGVVRVGRDVGLQLGGKSLQISVTIVTMLEIKLIKK